MIITPRVLAATETHARQDLLCYLQGNVLGLDAHDRWEMVYDVFTNFRCLINLPTWILEAQAINWLTENIRPGGLSLMIRETTVSAFAGFGKNRLSMFHKA